MREIHVIVSLGAAVLGAGCNIYTSTVDPGGGGGGEQPDLGPGACPEISDGLESFQCQEIREMRLADLPPSRGNKYADDDKAAVFGHYNFFDPKLSGAGGVSCATCHPADGAFQDGLPVSTGVGVGTRNAPTTLTAARVTTWFWDGRADALWSVPLFAIENPVELDQTRLQLAHQVAADPAMRAQYEAAFGPMPDLSDAKRFPAKGKPGDASWDGMAADDQRAVNRVFVNIGKSLEAYMRKATVGVAPFDRFLDGDQSAISPSARAAIPNYAKWCVGCHGGSALTNLSFIDFAFVDSPGFHDPGRAGAVPILVSNPLGVHGELADPVNIPGVPAFDAPESYTHQFRTPSLREIAKTAPYTHGGAVANLADMVNHIATLSGVDNQNMVALMSAFSCDPPPAPWNAPPATPRPAP